MRCRQFFLDYVAFGALVPAVVEAVVAGVAAGCRENGCALIGGETAEMPGLYTPPDYDLAGFIVGYVEEDESLGPDARARRRRTASACASSGLHTNGYSLARRIVSERMKLGVTDPFPGEDSTVAGRAARASTGPTCAALRPVLGRIHAMAHITGGGLPGNLNRALRRRISMREWTPPAGRCRTCSRVLQRAGDVPTAEMFRAFNMGVGMVVIVAPDDADAVLASAAAAGVPGWRLGQWWRGRGGWTSNTWRRYEVALVCGRFSGPGALGVNSASAQEPQCVNQSQVQVRDACQQAVDVFHYIAPELGAAIAGGNATLGQGGTLGGFGHFSIGVRANVVAGSLPQVDKFNPRTTGYAPPQTLPTKDNQPVPMPVADASLGLFQGIPLGLTNVGGIDLLVNVAYIPTLNQNSLSLSTPNGSWKFGYGARLGIVQESVVMPGVSVTYLKRDLPEFTLVRSDRVERRGRNPEHPVDPELRHQDLGVAAGGGQDFVVFGLAAGVGQDKYNQSADVQATVGPSRLRVMTSSTIRSQDVTRTNYFVGALDQPFDLQTRRRSSARCPAETSRRTTRSRRTRPSRAATSRWTAIRPVTPASA